jgi:hypothetical protein
VSFHVWSKVASFIFQEIVIARVRSIARLRDDALAPKGKGAITERGVVDEVHDNVESTKRTESVLVSDTCSQSNAEGDSDAGSPTRSCYLGPSTMTISRVQEMIDQGYFTEGGAHASGEGGGGGRKPFLSPIVTELSCLRSFLPLA